MRVLTVGRKMLETLGYQVTACGGPIGALEIVRERAADFDLVITDLNMPKMDGFAVMLQLSLLNPDDYLPLLILTAEEESVRFKALQSGAKDFLHKPYQHLDVVLKSKNIIEVR